MVAADTYAVVVEKLERQRQLALCIMPTAAATKDKAKRLDAKISQFQADFPGEVFTHPNTKNLAQMGFFFQPNDLESGFVFNLIQYNLL